MKKIKGVLLLVTLLVLLVGAVSAVEVSDNTTSTGTVTEEVVQTQTVSQETINEEINVNDNIKGETSNKKINKKDKNNINLKEAESITTWEQLNQKITEATTDTTITLQENITNTETITLEKPNMVITIDGNGKTINGNQKRVFNIKTGSSLVLKNITIQNAATEGNGGAIENYGSITIINSSLINNQATHWGGAIYSQGTSVIIYDSTLNNNTVSSGGAIYCKSGTLNVNNSTLNNNRVVNKGGVIYGDEGVTITITNSTLNNNKAETGGVISILRGFTTINNTVLNNNYATTGGVIATTGGETFINNSTLENNTATTSGGAIHFVVYKNEHSININNSKFIENHASIGAAIGSDRNDGGTIYITNNHFSKNTANNKETIDMVGQGTIVDNTYDSTDIALKTVNLTLKDERESFDYNDEVVLNIKVELENPGHYDQDILEKINKTIYINDIENITTAGENYTYSNLKLGEYTIYYKTCNQESNTVTFRVTFRISNWQELRDAVSYASGKTEDITLTLEDGTYTNTGTIEWNNPNMVLTIDGNGQTIDGNQQRVFYIDSGSSLVLKNITIKNAKSDFGGAIYNYGRLTITQSTLTENKATNNGGAIYNDRGNLIITQSAFTGNTAFSGGAILNGGKLIITQSTFTDNTGTDWGGAIRLSSFGNAVISDCNFTSNTASEGAAIHTYGYVNLTGNIFTENKATSNKETIDLYGQGTGEFDGNVYNSTDISLDEISLIIKDDKNIITITDNITLNYTIRPSNSNYYYDFEEGISDIILYINGEKNITTKYESTTLTNLEAGEYEVYFTSCNQQSNTVTFTVKYDSDITTPLDSYEYYPGINTKIPFNITDPSGAKGSIELDVYEDGVGYKSLSVYPNVGDEYILSTETIVQLLENMYGNLDSSYVIGAYYVSNYRYTNPKLTNFSLNINKQRNTTIVYDIINNTEGNVQINITVQDAVYKTPIADATIQITGDITQTTTHGIITDNTLTSGDHTINVKYEENDDYKESETTIDFIVEIDKDKKIQELEDNITNLTEKLDETIQELDNANNTINTLNETNKNLTKDLEEANKQITTLNNTNKDLNKKVNDLTEQLTSANNQIETLNNSINNLTDKLENRTKEIQNLNNTVNNLTEKLEEANKEINSLNNSNNQLKEQLDESNKKVNSLNDTNKKLEQQLTDANKQINNLNNTNKNLTTQVNKANKEIKTLNNTVNNLNKQVNSLNQSNNKLTNQLKDANKKISTLNETNQNLTTQLNKANKEIQTLNTTNKNLEKEVNTLNNTVNTLTQELKEQLDESNKKVNSLNDTNKKLEQQFTDANKQINNLNNTNKNLTTQVNKANKEIKTLNNTVNNLNKQVNSLNQSNNKLTNQLKDANKKISTLNETNQNLTTQLNKANKEIQTLNTTNKNLEKEVNTLNNTVNTLTQELKDANKEIKTLNNTLNKANKQIKALNNTNKKLNNQLNEAQKQIKTLNNTVNKLNKQLEKANKQIKTLNNTNKKLTTQLEEANKKIDKLRREIEKLNNKTKLNTTITINQIQSSVGSIVKISANIKDQNGKAVTDGRVIFKINGKTLKDEYNNVIYALVSNGTASIKYKVNEVWLKNTTTIQATYGGSQKYASSKVNSSSALNISKGRATLTLDQTNITAKAGETITLRAKVLDINGDRINSSQVVFKLNGKTLTDKNGKQLNAKVVDGDAILQYTIPADYGANTYKLSAVYGGSYERTETTGKLNIERKAVTINTPNVTTKNGKTRIKATITDENGVSLTGTTKLTIKVNGKTVLNNITSNNGKIDVSFITSLKQGMYELLIISGENGLYKTGKMTTVLKI